MVVDTPEQQLIHLYWMVDMGPSDNDVGWFVGACIKAEHIQITCLTWMKARQAREVDM